MKGESAIEDIPILQVMHLIKHFPVHGGIFLRKQGVVHAVDDVSFDVRKGQTLGLVGESGCGKTTLGRCIMGLYPLSGGSVKLHGQNITGATGKKLKSFRLRMQMIFQDPFESLNSRHTVGEILEEKYIIHNRLSNDIRGSGNSSSRRREIVKLLDRVGLSEQAITRFPHEFSGGQRQRIGIARAISLEPEVLICDEPVSALDVSVQSQILNLMLTLQKDMGLTSVFISHDLAVVRHVSDHIAVMYLGKIVEMADAGKIYDHPMHPYTKALLSAVPVADPKSTRERIILKGEVPSPLNPPEGCRFHTRCEYVMDICKHQEPRLEPSEAVILKYSSELLNSDNESLNVVKDSLDAVKDSLDIVKESLKYTGNSNSNSTHHLVACHLYHEKEVKR
ncbi:MAG: ATP-binding cassette domain-containing protein [Desulfamplus sp.]|nr:ATP-binding cassette domain-containing protein [Desulfamplus sp.]